MLKSLSIIVAIDEKNGIGLKNNLLTHIPNDLKRFKQITKGNTVIMGRNTWLSLPKKPLSNRTNIVLTTNKHLKFDGAITVNSIDEAMQKCNDNEEIFIIGGAKIYQQFLPLTQKLYLTKIHKTFNADTFFPEILDTEWSIVEQERITTDEQANTDYSFINLERK